MKFNSQGLEIIKKFEGCSLQAYLDEKGIPTIGFGCTHHVTKDLKITLEDAVDRLKEDVEEVSSHIAMIILPMILNDNQFSACICLAYNIGVNAFKKSTLLYCIQMKDFKGAAEEFLRWDKINGEPSAGLLKRREAERALFLA